MILATLFILGGLAMAWLAWRAIASARDGGWVRGAGTCLVIEAAPRREKPELRLVSGDAILFGPIAADWAPAPDLSLALGNPEAVPGRAGGAVMPGTYRVLALLDLTAPDAIASGTTALDPLLRRQWGDRVVLLAPDAAGRPPILLHAVQNGGRGPGGIAVARGMIEALTARTGDPAGLAVEVIRRRIRRDGWGKAQASRQRRIG
jgi:hypothetical protein